MDHSMHPRSSCTTCMCAAWAPQCSRPLTSRSREAGSSASSVPVGAARRSAIDRRRPGRRPARSRSSASAGSRESRRRVAYVTQQASCSMTTSRCARTRATSHGSWAPQRPTSTGPSSAPNWSVRATARRFASGGQRGRLARCGVALRRTRGARARRTHGRPRPGAQGATRASSTSSRPPARTCSSPASVMDEAKRVIASCSCARAPVGRRHGGRRALVHWN